VRTTVAADAKHHVRLRRSFHQIRELVLRFEPALALSAVVYDMLHERVVVRDTRTAWHEQEDSFPGKMDSERFEFLGRAEASTDDKVPLKIEELVLRGDRRRRANHHLILASGDDGRRS
jgi:hypothetical protein